MTTRAEIDRLLHWMPIVVRDGSLSDWERQFCASMIRRDRAGRFSPSARQARVMRGIVDRVMRSALREDPDQGQVIE